MRQPSPPPAPADSNAPERLRLPALPVHLPAAILLVCMGALLAAGVLRDSPTVDEGHHLAAGMGFWWGEDARLSTPHPPLANALQAVPAALREPHLEISELRGWEPDWHFGNVARAYLAADYERAREGIIAGRFITALLTLLLGLYLYLQLLPHGLAFARVALLLFAFHPLFLAHGRLVTTDFAVTAGVVLVVGETLRYLRTRSLLPLLGLGLALGLALSTKFSALFVLPGLVASLGLAAWRGGARYASPAPLQRWGLASRDLVILGALSCLVISASYRFQRTGWSVGEILDHPEPFSSYASPDGTIATYTPLSALPSWLPIPLPYPYLFGLATIRGQSQSGHGGMGSWFWGERTEGGSLLYFPVLTVIKTPAALSLALLAALALLSRSLRRRGLRGLRAHGPEVAVVSLVPLTFFAFSLPSGIQIGVRHLLPVMPFLVVLGAWAARRVWESTRQRSPRGAQLLAVGFMALLVAEVASNHPRYISHFNWLIGGSSVGHRISMVGESWGQDVGDLAAVMKERERLPLYYMPYGAPSVHELRYHGVPYRRFGCRTKVEGPAWIAVHASHVVRFKGRCGPIAKDRQPDEVVNDHIYLYRVE